MRFALSTGLSVSFFFFKREKLRSAFDNLVLADDYNLVQWRPSDALCFVHRVECQPLIWRTCEDICLALVPNGNLTALASTVHDLPEGKGLALVGEEADILDVHLVTLY